MLLLVLTGVYLFSYWLGYPYLGGFACLFSHSLTLEAEGLSLNVLQLFYDLLNKC